MKKRELTVPQIGLIAFTRALLGAGIALLLSERITSEQRRAVGWTLFLVGFATTFPLLADVFGRDVPAAAAKPASRRRGKNLDA